MTARFTTRSAHYTFALLAVPVALVGDPARAGAQQRYEVTATTRAGTRAELDSTGRMVRRLKLRADSLARLYDDDVLSAGARQRVGDELDRTMAELEQALGSMRASRTVRVHMAPMRDARAARAMSRVLMQRSVATDAVPRGWLGIVVNGVAREPRIERGELIVHYLTHPEIVTVEPSSPAERAGLAPGDTLIAYDGRDVRDVDISMTRLLKPNARVLVRIGRDGRQRDVPVTIADAPSRIVLRSQEMNGPMETSLVASPMTSGSGFSSIVTAPTSGAVSAPRRARVRITVPAAPLAPTPVAFTGVAGAQMGSLTREWARLTGVAHGVLVIRAPTGSLAAESGLRDADVIVRAGGRDIRTVDELRDLIGMSWNSGERALAIEYVRERKARSGMLRW